MHLTWSLRAACKLHQVSGLMCSYNSMNGVPSCANDWLLKEVARGEWGFDGYLLRQILVYIQGHVSAV